MAGRRSSKRNVNGPGTRHRQRLLSPLHELVFRYCHDDRGHGRTLVAPMHDEERRRIGPDAPSAAAAIVAALTVFRRAAGVASHQHSASAADCARDGGGVRAHRAPLLCASPLAAVEHGIKRRRWQQLTNALSRNAKLCGIVCYEERLSAAALKRRRRRALCVVSLLTTREKRMAIRLCAHTHTHTH